MPADFESPPTAEEQAPQDFGAPPTATELQGTDFESPPTAAESADGPSPEGHGFLAANHPNSPDEIAKAKDHADQLALTPTLTAADPKGAENAVQGQQVSWLSRHLPEWFNKWYDGDPNRPGLIKDDVGNAAGHAWSLKSAWEPAWDWIVHQESVVRKTAELYANMPGSAMVSAIATLAFPPAAPLFATKLGASLVAGKSNQERITELDKLDQKDYGDITAPQRMLVATSKAAPFLLADAGARALGGIVGGTIGAAAGGVGAVPGAAIGQQAGSAIFNSFEASGELYWRISQQRDANGQQIDPQLAAVAATIGGAAQGWVASTLLGKVSPLAKVVAGKAAPLFDKVGLDTANKFLSSNLFLSLASKLGGRWTKSQIAGALLGAVQAGTNALTENAAKKLSGLDFENNYASVLSDVWQSSLHSLESFALISAVTAGIEVGGETKHIAGELKAAKEARPFTKALELAAAPPPEMEEAGRLYTSVQHASQWENLTNGSMTSKLLDRSPEEYSRWVAAMKGQQGAAQSVGHPVEAFDKYWQDQGADPAQMAAQVARDGGRAYAEAKRTGGDVIFPIERALTALGKTKHLKGLANDTRLYFADSNDTFTPNEASEYAQQYPEASRTLTSQHEQQTPEQGVETFYKDKNTGVLNQRALDRIDLAPGEHVLDMDQEGQKYLNDTIKRADLADAKSRALAKVLEDAAPGRVFKKSGGGFVVRGFSSEADALAFGDATRGKAPKGYGVTAAAAPSIAEAAQKHADLKTSAEALPREAPGSRALRGAEPYQFSAAKHLSFPEGRANAQVPVELRSKLAGMSSEERYRAVHLDSGTGLLSGEGFGALPKKQHTLVVDVPGLNALNKAHGMLNGDRLLHEFGNAARKHGAEKFDMAHLHGDEYVAQSDNLEELKAFEQTLKKVGESLTVEFHDKETGNPVGHLHGTKPTSAIGEGQDAAYVGLALEKQRRGNADIRAAEALGAYKPLERAADGSVVNPPRIADSIPPPGADQPGGARAQTYARPRRAGLASEADRPEVRAALSVAAEHSPTTLPLGPALQHLTPEAKAAHYEALTKSADSVRAAVEKRVKEIQEQRVGHVRQDAEQQFTEEADQQPVYRATRYLQDGELANDTGGVSAGSRLPSWLRNKAGKHYKFSREEVEGLLGKDATAGLPGEIFARAKGRELPADELAGYLGFSSAEEFFQKLRDNPPRKDYIAQRVQDHLDEVYGPALKQLMDTAMAAAHNEHEVKARLLEIRAMAGQVDPETLRRVNAISYDRLKSEAAQHALSKPLDALDPRIYERAERAKAEEAAKLWGAGEKEKSVAVAQERLFNSVMYRAVRDLQDQAESSLKRLEQADRSSVSGRLGKAGAAYRDVQDTLLSALGISTAQTHASFDALVQQADLDKADLSSLNQPLLRDLMAHPRPWGSLTTSEAQDVMDAVGTIQTVARSKVTSKLDGRARDRDAQFAELQAQLDKLPPKPVRPLDPATESMLAKMKDRVLAAWSQMYTPETWARFVDGHDVNGILRRLTLEPMDRARHTELTLQKEFLPPILAAFKELPKELQKAALKTVDIWDDLPEPPPAISKRLGVGPVTKRFLYMMFLNMGNEGNKRWLLESYGWSEDQVLKVLEKHLDPKELDYLQTKVLDNLDGLKPYLKKLHEEDTGRKFDEVEASPITIGGKEYRGGYFPSKVDRDVAQAGARQKLQNINEVTSVGDLFSQDYTFGTERGHTKSRVDGSVLPPSLDWNVVASHMTQVIHDIAYRTTAKDVANFLLDPRFANIDLHLGEHIRPQILSWLYDTVNNSAASAGAGMASVNPITSWFRSFVSQRALGGNIASYLRHFVDPLETAMFNNVRRTEVAKAYGKAASGGFGDMKDFALEHSTEIQSRRLHHEMQVLLPDLKDIGGAHGALHVVRTVQDASNVLHNITASFVETIIWHAKYSEIMAGEQKSGAEQYEAHKTAVRQADISLNNAIPSGSISHLAQALRQKSWLGTVLMFTNYTNKVLNQMVQQWDLRSNQYAAATSLAGKVAAPAAFAGSMFGAMAVAGIGAYLAGKGPGPGEDKKKWAMHFALAEPFKPIPIASDMADVMAEYALTGSFKDLHFHNAPLLALLEDNWRRAKAAKNHTAEEKLVDGLSLMAGTLTGAPSQVEKTMKYWYNVHKGNVRIRNPLDAVGGTIYGEDPKHPKGTPFTLLTGK